MIDNEKMCGSFLILCGVVGIVAPLFNKPFTGTPIWFTIASIAFIAIGIYVYFLDEW